MERFLGLLLKFSFSSTLSSFLCSFSLLHRVPHCRGEDDDMGRLGLGLSEAMLAEARRTVLVRQQCSPANITDTAFEKPFGMRTPSEASLRIPLGIPLSETYSCWLGLLPGESILELELEPGLWLGGSEGVRGVRGSKLVPSWQRGAGVRQELGSWKGRRRCKRAGFVPETGRPRLRSCCLNSDTWGNQNSWRWNCNGHSILNDFSDLILFLPSNQRDLQGEAQAWVQGLCPESYGLL